MPFEIILSHTHTNTKWPCYSQNTNCTSHSSVHIRYRHFKNTMRTSIQFSNLCPCLM